jgi:proteasome lid subunit RPN8/RPN11
MVFAMLKMTEKDYAEIRRHGEETYPHECCGVLLGQMEGDVRTVTSTARCGNTRTDSPQNRYHIDPKDLVRNHSHPDHPAQWSKTDFEEAHWIGCSYVITRVAQGKAEVTNSFELAGTDEADKAFRDENVEVR